LHKPVAIATLAVSLAAASSAAGGGIPSLSLDPGKVQAGQSVTASGKTLCSKGDEILLISKAFPHKTEFAGVAAVKTHVKEHHKFSRSIKIPSGRAAGKYSVAARCGGGSWGADHKLKVLAP
jgi:hypothetical protein